MSAPRRVLLLKPGVTSSREVLGDYEAWFSTAAGDAATMVPVELHQGERPPSLLGFDAVLMSGSPLSVTALHQPAAPADRAREWMVLAADLLLEAAERVPVLGSCFGHQLLGWRLGATVRQNPRGKELGTVEVQLTQAGLADPLFEGLPPTLLVQATHEDEVVDLPPGASLLATNAASPVQAFALGRKLRAVQFHPEMTRASIAYCIERDARPATAPARDSTHGAAIIRNFLTRL